jgi:hypothetical protein
MARVLKFVSGRYRDGEFPLASGDIIIGRSPDAEIVMAEDMVSRKHARLRVSGDSVSITDLGSTNGTYVNGERVQRADIEIGDRVLVGTSIFRICDGCEAALDLQDHVSARIRLAELGERPVTTTMSGDLTDVPLPDLLQLFASSHRTGILSLDGPHRGRLWIKAGRVVHAEHGGLCKASPLKALCRMVGWRSGFFALEDVGEADLFPESFAEATEVTLMEAMRQHDELSDLLRSFPEATHRAALPSPLLAKFSDLGPEEMEALQTFLSHDTILGALDDFREPDLAAIQMARSLIARGFLACP